MLPKSPEEFLSSSERRNADRKKLIVDVRFVGGDATGIANTRDIGIGGLYISTKVELEIGTQISMSMMVDEKELSLSGTIVYSDPGHGVGVRFQDLSEENKAFLKKELNLE
jgi:PilZ domain